MISSSNRGSRAILSLVFGVPVLAIPLAFVWGQDAGLGMLLGVLGTGVSVLGLRAVVWFMAKSAESEAASGPAGLAAVLALLIKLPLFVFCAMAAFRLGPAGPVSFLVGLGLVYCALIFWAQARVRA